MPSHCPYCPFVAHSVMAEVEHMNRYHADVIEQRLERAGIEVQDLRDRPDLPSFLTLLELQTLLVFAAKLAQDAGLNPEQAMIGIHVRDRGMASRVMAPWIEFSVGLKHYAFWRATMDLYEVGPDGAVGDDPIHSND